MFCLGEPAVVPDVFFKGALWDLAEGQVKGKMRYQRPHVQDCELAQITELPDWWPALLAEYDYSGVDGSGTHRIQDVTGMEYLTGLKVIGEGALRRQSGNPSWQYASLLEGFVIPAGVETVKRDAFRGNNQLYAGLDHFETVEQIGDSVFRYCRKLYGVLKFNDGITVIPDFFGENLAADDMAWKEDGGKHGITQLTLPDSLVEIGASAFYNTVGIHGTLNLKNVQRIGNNAFYGTRFTGNLYLPDTMVDNADTGYQAFGSISSMTGSLHISENPGFTVIGYGMFAGTPLSGTLVIPNNIKEIREGAFANTNFSGKVTVPDSVIAMFLYSYYSIFEKCIHITEIEVKGHCGNIVANSFCRNCTGLQAFTFQNSVEEISDYTFQNCVNLEAFHTNGAAVRSVGYNAFEGCVKLGYFPTKDLVTVKPYAFSGVPLTGDNGVLDLSSAVDIGVVSSSVQIFGECFNSVTATSVLFGPSLRTISRGCFGSGRNFDNFILPEGLTAFMNDSVIGRNIRRWTIPSTLKYISFYRGGTYTIVNHTISCDELSGTFNITGPFPGFNPPSFAFFVNIIFNDLDGDGVLDVDVTGTLCYGMRAHNPDLSGLHAQYNGAYIVPVQFKQLLGVFNTDANPYQRNCYFGQNTYEDYIAAYPGREELTAARGLGWQFYYYDSADHLVEVS